MNLRNAAKGRSCMVRLPDICLHNDELTILAHVRLAGITGAGQKAPDLLGAWCCSACHDEIDGRSRVLERDFVKTCFYEGVLRTQNILIREGRVKW